MIKPIETSYKGYKFRSRLEARWAIFFDELGIKWEYELEGFELPSGKRYLPDFWLSEMNIFVEIKASPEFISVKEFMKLVEFGSLKKLMVIFGVPAESIFGEHNKMILFQENYDFALETINDLLEMGASEEIAVNEAMGNIEDYGDVRFSMCPIHKEWVIIKRKIDPIDYSLTSDASQKARSARFEFGERK